MRYEIYTLNKKLFDEMVMVLLQLYKTNVTAGDITNTLRIIMKKKIRDKNFFWRNFN